MKAIANFFYEAGMLAKTPRSGFYFLGSGDQSVAEHINRVCYIAYALAKLDGDVDMGTVLEMALFHDFAETRVSDLNYVHQKYIEKNEEQALKDLADTLSFGTHILDIIDRYEVREEREAIIVKDADILELLVSLKEQLDTGNTRAEVWIKKVVNRVQTKAGKELAMAIITTDSDMWHADNDDKMWDQKQKSTPSHV